ncbi:DNA glycosylase AlkZ-like family protein [Mobilicoccus massiliensis]|uniref:DNA glycosylase AlkZ-like family protein n=1 Tax=Mobilicoccus massiliensis TaxID=1522310 RepID=UPI00058C0DE1|nr:crosslink repair DNA glycosylase YcaQ family protein [Mobilicoccus massiliensis]
MNVTREQVLRYRWHVQQLDRDVDTTTLADLAILDLGVQNGAQDAARCSFVDRGVPVGESIDVTSGFHDDVALVWGVRGAPHHYRRRELPDVATALSPLDAADAYKRLAGTGGVWKKADVDPFLALANLGEAMRDRLERPTAKGVLSTELHGNVPAEYETDCRPCNATHPAEMAFRLAPLFAGVELEPGTSPPVLRRVPGWPTARPVGPAADHDGVPRHLDVTRAYLHFLGPATPGDVAAYLDTTATIVKRTWPTDAVEVDRAGTRAWILPEDVDALEDAARPGPGTVRLLSPFDLFTAAKDRTLLVEKARHKEAWPVLGRPGLVAVDGEIVGTWRPSSKGTKLTVRIEPWVSLDATTTEAIEERAEILAAVRERTLADVTGL